MKQLEAGVGHRPGINHQVQQLPLSIDALLGRPVAQPLAHRKFHVRHSHFQASKEIQTMKLLAVGILSLCINGCASYFQPPKPASEMWKPTNLAKVDVKTALEQCNFVDRLSAGGKKIQDQAICMRDMGFDPDFSSYNAHNCYGDAPAACIVYWRQGAARPAPANPQAASTSN